MLTLYDINNHCGRKAPSCNNFRATALCNSLLLSFSCFNVKYSNNLQAVFVMVVLDIPISGKEYFLISFWEKKIVYRHDLLTKSQMIIHTKYVVLRQPVPGIRIFALTQFDALRSQTLEYRSFTNFKLVA